MDPDDVRRIAFATRRFHALQGLRRAAQAMWVLAVLVALPHVEALGDSRSPFSVPLVVLALSVWLLGPPFLNHRVERYYRRTFGCVSVDRMAVALWVLPGMLLVMVAAWFDLRRAGTGLPSVAALICAAGAGVLVVRDWPWRWYHTLAIGAGLIASMSWASPRSPANALLTATAVICAGVVVTGYLDHRLLVRTLGPQHRTADDVAVEVIDGL